MVQSHKTREHLFECFTEKRITVDVLFKVGPKMFESPKSASKLFVLEKPSPTG